MSDGASTYLRLAGSLDYPLFVVTACEGSRQEGCLIGFQTQCSFDPARFLACLSKANRTYRMALRVDALAVHVVPRSRRALAELFGGLTGDDVDKFASCAWHPGPRGLPILDDCPSWFAGEIRARHDLGDHVGFLLDPFAAQHEAGHDALGFQEVKQLIAPGHPVS